MPDRPQEHRGPDPTRATPRGKRGSGARRVRHYRIDGEVGRGGMGVVYRAFDERLHRDVALKALPEDLVGDREQLARLEREARALALVSHPNVATIHGMEQDGGACYLVLELVEGETLRSRLDRGALDVDEALSLCAHVASGLAAVHRKGLVHRDLKPSNVMVTTDGVAKLLDFGLARQARAAARGEVTRRGAIMGTSGWMSPEQLRGEELDARSDAWAWGCLLYECLAGTRAFLGDTEAERDAATLKDEPAWELLPEVPATVADLLKSCLSKDRAARPNTMDDAHRLLDEARRRSSERRAVVALPKHSLPAERDAFVGREADLQDLARCLDDGAHLVSVLGIGGTGKTRLVTHFCRTRLGSWPGGAWFCDLSEARSLEGICSAVASGLDVPLGKDDSIVQLGHALAGRGKCLVILDNFEQVARHAPETLGKWLDRAGEAQFIVTTREVLGLPGETSLALAPLRGGEAVELFVARAIQAERDFVLTDADRPHVQALVKLLDHLPLAIELAAARVRVMPPKSLLQRMSERFKLLTSSGGRHTRQATLHATLDWSWELLLPDERQALAQLSVFEGGFTLESAEAVLSLSDAWPADAVQSLVNKSFVLRVSDERFDLLVSVHEYASEKLESLGGRTEAHARHGAHFAGYGTEEALAALDTHGGVARLQALAFELDNLVAACRRAVLRGEGATAVATFLAAENVLALRGPVLTAAELGKLVLGIGTLEPAQRARACRETGRSLLSAGRVEEARLHQQEALGIAREIGDRRSEGRVLRLMGGAIEDEGMRETALQCYDSSLAIAREVCDRNGEGATMSRLGVLHARQGRMEEALRLLQGALAIARELGNRRGEGNHLCDLGLVHKTQGRMEDALRHFEESLAVNRQVGSRRSEAIALSCGGLVREEQGRFEDAMASYQESLAIHREVGNREHEGHVLGLLGNLHSAQGRSDEALRCHHGALAIAREIGNRNIEGNSLGNLANVVWQQGREEEALRHYHEALVALRQTGNRRNEGWVHTSIAELHAQQGRTTYARASCEAAEALLRDVGDPVGIATVLCARARVDHAEGRADAARGAITEAESLAASVGARPESALGQKLAGVRALLDGGIDVRPV